MGTGLLDQPGVFGKLRSAALPAGQGESKVTINVCRRLSMNSLRLQSARVQHTRRAAHHAACNAATGGRTVRTREAQHELVLACIQGAHPTEEFAALELPDSASQQVACLSFSRGILAEARSKACMQTSGHQASVQGTVPETSSCAALSSYVHVGRRVRKGRAIALRAQLSSIGASGTFTRGGEAPPTRHMLSSSRNACAHI